MSCLDRPYFPCQMEIWHYRKKPRVFRETARSKALKVTKRPNENYIQPMRRAKQVYTQPPISVSEKWLKDRGIETFPF